MYIVYLITLNLTVSHGSSKWINNKVAPLLAAGAHEVVLTGDAEHLLLGGAPPATHSAILIKNI